MRTMRAAPANSDAPATPTSAGRALSDRLLGPGATAGEVAMALGAAATAAVVLPMSAAWSGVEWTTLQRLLAALIAADLAGGVVVNASAPARGYYFRPGRGEAHHLGFVALHGVHIALFAAFFATGGATTAAVMWGGLLLGAVLIRAVPVHLRRATAMLCLLTGIVAWQALGSAPGAEWFVPALLLKLLVCYLLGDVPGTARPASLARG